MLFNSLKFLVFFPAVFYLYWLLPQRFRKYFLLASSYYFYMCWKPEFIVLVLLSTVVDYFCALGMERFPKRKNMLLTISLTMNLGLLFFFKYFNFFGESLTAVCRAVSIPFSSPVLDIILPVGISFYTFQTLSYTIDVYKGKLNPEHDFVLFALFVSYFPQLVAGPIEKASNLLPQLRAPHTFQYDQAAYGARLIGWGFFKKCIAASYLAQLVDAVYSNAGAASGGAAALATAAFALQIYCDFGGYSDIARGCSEMMGIHLMENFKAPYFAVSMRDFWRRWHISLTSWFREYVYFPLGGSRISLGITLRNTWIVFALSGLWHGANWTFVVWGLLQALYLGWEILWQHWHKRTDSGKYPSLMRLKVFILACIAWVFFRANSMSDAVVILLRIMTGLAHPRSYILDALHLLFSGAKVHALITFFAVALLFFIDYRNEKEDVMKELGHLNPVVRYLLYTGFLVCLILLIPKSTAVPFIYFQF